MEPDRFTHDVCIVDLEEHHHVIVQQVTQFPILTFGSNSLYKTGNFNENGLNLAFNAPISLMGKNPPLSYYPFFIEDSNAYVAPYVIRALVEIGLRKSRSGASLEVDVSYTEVVESIFKSVWDTMSSSIKRELTQKVENVLDFILTEPEMRNALKSVEKRRGIRVIRPLSKLQSVSEDFIKKCQSDSTLDRFIG